MDLQVHASGPQVPIRVPDTRVVGYIRAFKLERSNGTTARTTEVPPDLVLPSLLQGK